MTDMHYHMSQFVGRTDELSTLFRLLQSVEESTAAPHIPRCLLLEGEAGIGKTRLAEEVHLEAESRGWTVLWVRAYEQEQGVAYYLWTQVLRQLLARKLWQFSTRRKHSSLFSPLLALLPEHDPHPSEQTLDALLPGQPLRLWEAVLALLTEVSNIVPLLLVLDDIHALDESSIELLGFLARHLPDRLVLVGTYREYERSLPSAHVLHTLVAHLQRENHVLVLRLGPLSDEHIHDLLASIPHITESTIQKIQAQAAGNAFFAEELARTRSFEPSTTLEAALNARLHLLSSECRKMLQNASVLGGSFAFALLSRLESDESLSVSDDMQFTLLEEAVQAKVLIEEDGSVPTYRFSHPLVSHHLYNSISAARRARTHRRLATLLIKMYQGRDYEEAETITYHLVEGGGDAAHILLYAEMAADRAYRLSAYTQAEHYLRIAVEQREQQLPRREAVSDLHLASLLERLGECTRIRGADEEARLLYQRAFSIQQQQNENQDARESVQLQALLCCEIGQTWYNIGKYDQAAISYQQGQQLLSQRGIETGTVHARIRFEQSYLLWREGHYDEAQTAGQEALTALRQALSPGRQEKSSSRVSTIRSTLASDPVDIGRTYVILGLIANSRGRPREAIEHWTAALALFEQYERVREIANVSCDLGDVYLKEANHSAAQTVLTRALDLAERVNDIPLMSVIYGNLGNLAARTGKLDDAEDFLRQALVFAEQASEPLYKSIMYSYLATIFRDQGILAEARMSVARALRLSRAIRNGPCLALALVTAAGIHLSLASVPTQAGASDTSQRKRYQLEHAKRLVAHAHWLEGVEGEVKAEGFLLLGEIALGQNTNNAWDHLQSALSIVQTSSLSWLLPRTYALLARVLAVQGQHAQADSFFQQALNLFHEYILPVEHARAVYQYGSMLLYQHKETDQDYARGITYLQEAERLCQQSEAIWDLRLVEHVLATIAPSFNTQRKGMKPGDVV